MPAKNAKNLKIKKINKRKDAGSRLISEKCLAVRPMAPTSIYLVHTGIPWSNDAVMAHVFLRRPRFTGDRIGPLRFYT